MSLHGQERFNYILQLRGLAALMVVICHHCQFFWLDQFFCGQLTQHQPTIQIPKIATILEVSPINLGNFGVAIFFLITGFLMPLVAKQKTRKQFMIRRIKRIYPPYLVSLLLVFFLGYCYAKYQGNPYPWSYDHMLFSLFMIRDIGQYAFIDGIVWTLEIELKFYLLCMLALPWLSKKPVQFIALIIGLSALSLAVSHLKLLILGQYGVHLINLSAKTMQLITFIGLGAVLSYWHQKRLSLPTLIIASAMLASLYYCHGFNRNIEYQEVISYALALMVFTGSYLARHKFTDRNLLAHTGKISYSLYLVHGVPGFFILYALVDYGAGIAIAAALIYSIVAGISFYWFVEKPLLKKLSQAG